MDITISDYLLTRLNELGIQHIFGVPGDYNLGFLTKINNNPDIQWIGNCNELNGAYAADGYARIKGIGAIVTTFGVGELSALNGIAGSYAEYVPTVMIVGAPALSTQARKTFVHHTLGTGDFKVFANMYKDVTVAQAFLTAENAATEIDRVLQLCWLKKRPVYISLPADVIHLKIPKPQKRLNLDYPISDPEAVNEGVQAIAFLLQKAKGPVILADLCALRHSMQALLIKLLDTTGIPFATMNLGKGIINESHPQYLGIYNGALSCHGVQARVENSDCILSFGTLLSDFNTGGFTAQLKASSTIEIHSDQVQIKHAVYKNIYFNAVLPALIKQLCEYHYSGEKVQRNAVPVPTKAQNQPITQAWLWPRIGQFWQENSIVIADIGSPIFGTLPIRLPDNISYISQPVWSSIGYSVGALLGTCFADPKRRSLLLVGDGAFQLTAQEISTILRHNLNPIIFLINNDGYTIERAIHGADMPYNDIQMWNYSELPLIFGKNVWTIKVNTQVDLEAALRETESINDKAVFIEIMVEKMDMPESLRKVGEAMAKQNRYAE